MRQHARSEQYCAQRWPEFILWAGAGAYEGGACAGAAAGEALCWLGGADAGGGLLETGLAAGRPETWLTR